MKNKYNKNLLIYIAIIIIAPILLVGANKIITKGQTLFGKLSVAPVYPATVDIVLARGWTNPELQTELQVYFEATISSGDKKGEEVLARQFISSSYVTNHKEIQQGDKVMLRYADYNDSKAWVFQGYNRSGYIAALLAVFIALLFIFGGKKGFATLVALTLTFLCLFLYFIPSILMGYNIYLATVVTCIFISVVTLILVNGISFKSLSAAVGTFGGIIIAGIIFKVMDSLLSLTGIVDEEANYLLIMDSSIQLKGIMFAAIVISALGAALDVAVSIAASVTEMYENKPEASFKDMFDSGVNIGRDIISTMTNTLILVYVGSALSGTLLLVMYSNSFLELINREAIIFEILQALIGSIGVLFTIPITSAFYALTHKFKINKTKHEPKNKAKEMQEPKEIVVKTMPEELKAK